MDLTFADAVRLRLAGSRAHVSGGATRRRERASLARRPPDGAPQPSVLRARSLILGKVVHHIENHAEQFYCDTATLGWSLPRQRAPCEWNILRCVVWPIRSHIVCDS